MKHSFFTLLLIAILMNGAAQPTEYTGRLTPYASKLRLEKAAFLNDITPDLWRNMALPAYERMDLNRRRIAHYQGYDVFPLGYNYLSPAEYNYNKIIDYLSVNITASRNGQTRTAESHTDQLSVEQKQLLSAADLNTDIIIDVTFKYKHPVSDEKYHDKIINGTLSITVVPETQAQFEGGFTVLRDDIIKSVMSKLPSGGAATSLYRDKLSRSVVKFTVSEEGKVTEASVSDTSGDTYLDALLIDALYHLPKWKPAKNAKGQTVKQQFRLSLRDDDGC